MKIICYTLTISTMLSLGLSHDWSFCELSKQMENQCASYCYHVVKPLLHMSEVCRQKDAQVSELQSQMEELRIKMAILETSLAEKEKQCELRIEHAKEIFSIEMRRKPKAQENTEDIVKDVSFSLSCVDIDRSSGIHMITLPDIEAFPVKCDSGIAGLGWTVIQSRLDGSINFYRSWNEYRDGFGDLKSEFFMGLEKLHRITSSERHELFIFMRDRNSQLRSARYDDFKVGGEQTGYELISIGNHTGFSDDILRGNLHMKFSTFDRDNDKCGDSNCAVDLHGGWWYNCCSDSNLNGGYQETQKSRRIFWNYSSDELITVHMLIRPKRVNLS
ncbi:ficolin-1-like [Drosophila nasuta]|uniref:ficolin-1-like n=1 Tax=Drosophila nasuta TaxID=42062 RepID=UPI00295F36E9|nr:ficolin-1-like [Drosophila nasuta]